MASPRKADLAALPNARFHSIVAAYNNTPPARG